MMKPFNDALGKQKNNLLFRKAKKNGVLFSKILILVKNVTANEVFSQLSKTISFTSLIFSSGFDVGDL